MLGKDLTNEEKLDQIYKMSLENYEILHSLRRQQYFANFLRLFYWLVVLGAIGGSYIYVRPLITPLLQNWDKYSGSIGQILGGQLQESSFISKTIESIKSEGGGTGTPAQ